MATVQNGTVYYIHADHLGTPRVITDQNNTEVWRWQSDPFGMAAANEDPDGDGQLFSYNLRFPGQYFDEETGLHYNYFRNYDPSTGRYIESDPIGLNGGLNTYQYVYGNPLRLTDTLGLEVEGEWIKAPHKGDINISFNCYDESDCLDLSSPELVLLNIQASAELTWKIRCFETENCNDDEWYLDGDLTFVAGRQIPAPVPWCTIMPKGYKGACVAAVAASLVIRIPTVRTEVIQDIYDQADMFLNAFEKAYDPTKICKASTRN